MIVTDIETKEATLAIWRKRVKVGDSVQVRTTEPNITALEGVVEELNLEQCFVALRNVGGLTFIPLSLTLYVEVLCESAERKYPQNGFQNRVGGLSGCEHALLNIWSRIQRGDSVFVSLQDEPFVATVEEVNLKKMFVGLRTESGVTYTALANVPTVRLMSKQRLPNK